CLEWGSALSSAPLRCATRCWGNARTRTAHNGITGHDRFCGWKGPGVRLMNDHDGLSPQAGRYGEHVRGGGASFRCAACGEMAAVVRLVRAGTTVNMGPPLGEQAYDRDGVIVDFWLGATCWRRLDPAQWARIEQVLTAGQPDPAALHKLEWEL